MDDLPWPAFSWLDLAVLGVLALSIVVGLMRGVVFELLSLAGWFAAWFGGVWLGPSLAPYVLGAEGSALNRSVAFASAFLAVLVVWAIGTRIVAALVKATPLKPFDRALGAAFGALRGVVVLLLAAMLVSWTPLSQSAAWRGSHGAAWLDETLTSLRAMWN